VTSRRTPWALGGVVAGAAGLATSYATATLLGVRESPVVAVAELVIEIAPGGLAERAIQALGHLDKPALIVGILVILTLVFALAGLAARRGWWAAALIFLALAGVGLAAVTTRAAAGPSAMLPVLVGLITWLVALDWLVAPLRRTAAQPPAAETPAADAESSPTRRGFVLRAGLLGAGSVVLVAAGRVLGSGRRRIEAARDLLRLDGVTMPRIPRGARIGLDDVTPWKTPNDEFYLIHTTITSPAIDPVDWRLRIHGMVDREVVLTYQQLLDLERTEAWITLNCVSNPIGGDLIGNAWWSGVRVSDVLAMAGVQDSADAVLQTSHDGWTCGTPLMALTDGRDAMLVLAMNGEPLPIDHGFPVRTLVPGLYGYVSACKWVVDMEVTRFDEISAYWTQRGWSELGPVKMASRIDVPRSGDAVAAGPLRVGGVAWAQHTGIEGVQVSLDGADWLDAEIASPPTSDTWVQWATTVDVSAGDHLLRVRAVDKTGRVQTGVRRDVIPDGATGWHAVDFSAAT
jgi:DMSO/TMAO reductase YedYZ molybdopterin-dependent catalytic subunit